MQSRIGKKLFLAGPIFALTTLAVLVPGWRTYAEVKPGDFITQDNATKVQDLLSPGVYYKVLRGMTMKIIPSQRVDWPPPYKDATQKYSGQVRLTDDHRSLLGYVAGQPFPRIDPNDPYAGTKIVWNLVYKPFYSDDYDLRFYDCETEYHAQGEQTKQVEYFQIGHYMGYNLVGRTEVEPLPIDPDFKMTHRLWIFGLYPVLAPMEIRGVGFIRWRYDGANRGDDTWSIGSGSRRVRRIDKAISSSSATSEGTAAFSWDPDHYSGFNGEDRRVQLQVAGREEHARHSTRRAFP